MRDGKKNDSTTFIVKIQYRQHASWQGTVTWVESKREQNFRSVLELISLMDEAVTVEDEPEKHSWE